MTDGSAFLRHAVATLAYRAGKVIRDAPADFGATRAGDGTRTAAETLGHISDVLTWAESMARGAEAWNVRTPGPWSDEVPHFHAACASFDAALAEADDLPCPAERLFQGPIADALTHVGQLATLRRLAGSPIKGENYFAADVEIGRVGAEQVAPGFEFD